MTILAVGLNHRTAPLQVRDRVAISREELEGAQRALRDRLGQGVILSTCNRLEVYSVAQSTESGAQGLVEYLTSYHAMGHQELAPYLYVHDHEAAVRHLYRVASGLDSMILGEAEILGQVRHAFAVATQQGLTDGTLLRLFHQALHVGKRSRTETRIGRNALSVSRAGVELARRAFHDLAGKCVLVIGLGEAGKLAARALADAGAREISVANRTYKRALEAAVELGGVAVPFERLGDALEAADILVTSTDAPGYLLTPEMIAQARDHAERTLFIIDIAVPRDVDPNVGDLPGVHLYDIDDLESVSETNRRERAREARKVEAIVDGEVDRFMEWLSSLDTVPTVAALRKRAEAIRAREVARLLKRLPDLLDEERQPLEAFSRALVRKILHDPITNLKRNRQPEQGNVVRELFNLDDEGS